MEGHEAVDTQTRLPLTSERKDQIYGLFLRGVTVDNIADQSGVDFERCAKVIADRLVVEGKADEQNAGRKAAGDALRALKRTLWAAMQNAANKATYASALARIESAILQVDGRCGARRKDGTGGFCEKYPVEGRTRCRLHGGASPRGGPGHHSYRTGIYSHESIVPVTKDEQAAMAAYEAEGTDIRKQIATQKLVIQRAVKMGNLTAASQAGAALASMIRAQRDAGAPPVDLEAALERAAAVFVAVVMKHVTDPAMKRSILTEFGSIDWSKVAVPTLAETTPGAGEAA